MTIHPMHSFRYHGPAEIRAAVSIADLVDPVAAALIDYSRGLGEAPIAFFAPAGRDGDVHVKSAWLPGRSIFTVKVATWFAARTIDGLPGGAGMIAAFDARTGDLRALLQDDHYLSDIRTAAAGALAARHLARMDAKTLGIIGTGVQAELQIAAVLGERAIAEVLVWGRNAGRATALCDKLRRWHSGIVFGAAESPAAVCAAADIIVTTTASTRPLIEAAWLRPGQHVTAIGADDPHKCELAAACFRRADRVIVDSRRLTLDHGDLHRALLSDAEAAGDIDAELGEVLSDAAPGRQQESDITICKLIGLGVQDLAAVETTLSQLDAGNASSRPDQAARIRPMKASTCDDSAAD